MISRLRGTVREQRDTYVLLDVHGVCYEIFMGPSILQALPERVGPDGEVEVITFHYQQLEVGRGIPMLIGFLNEIEREFFSRFISVSGVGPRAALKALTMPIPVIAQAIDEGDLTLLRSLPGIGEQRAKEIVAKLQGKVGKYALMRAGASSAHTLQGKQPAVELEDEAVKVLVQLEYKKLEAKQMVSSALARNSKVQTVEELLNEVYRQQRLSAQTSPDSHQAAVSKPMAQDSAKRPSRRRNEPLPIGER
jgi:Holliday junction DNA helicase RuvA